MGRIKIDLPKAKTIAHEKRRARREEEFAPLDEMIAKQIPGNDPAEVEAERQAIRDKYAQVQTDIEAAESPEAVKAVLIGAGITA